VATFQSCFGANIVLVILTNRAFDVFSIIFNVLFGHSLKNSHQTTKCGPSMIVFHKSSHDLFGVTVGRPRKTSVGIKTLDPIPEFQAIQSISPIENHHVLDCSIHIEISVNLQKSGNLFGRDRHLLIMVLLALNYPEG
jgi:hypothetical protein